EGAPASPHSTQCRGLTAATLGSANAQDLTSSSACTMRTLLRIQTKSPRSTTGERCSSASPVIYFRLYPDDRPRADAPPPALQHLLFRCFRTKTARCPSDLRFA